MNYPEEKLKKKKKKREKEADDMEAVARAKSLRGGKRGHARGAEAENRVDNSTLHHWRSCGKSSIEAREEDPPVVTVLPLE